jgi:hypothetical protein
MSSDETYLESFIESLSTLPHEVRRNLDLIKDLDQTCRYVSDITEKKYIDTYDRVYRTPCGEIPTRLIALSPLTTPIRYLSLF